MGGNGIFFLIFGDGTLRSNKLALAGSVVGDDVRGGMLTWKNKTAKLRVPAKHQRHTFTMSKAIRSYVYT